MEGDGGGSYEPVWAVLILVEPALSYAQLRAIPPHNGESCLGYHYYWYYVYYYYYYSYSYCYCYCDDHDDCDDNDDDCAASSTTLILTHIFML